MNKYQLGSKLLNLDNTRDNDFVILVDGDRDTNYRSKEDGDCFCMSKAYLDKFINFEEEFDYKTIAIYIVLYQYDKDIIGQNFPIEYHILDRKNDFIRLLKFIRENKLLNLDTEIKISTKENRKFYICSKIQYHIVYNLFIIKNNSVNLTAEQKAIIQKIHDRQMPAEYINTIIQEIDAL